MSESSLTPKYDIAIIGGGMVGLSLAILAAKKMPERKIVLIENFELSSKDQAYQPSFDARSTALASSSIKIFEQLGMWGELSQHVTAIRTVHVSDSGHIGTTSYSEQDNYGEPLGVVIENRWLGQQLVTLAKTLPSIELLAPASVAQLQFKSDRVVVGLEDGSAIEASLAVVADGANSVLRNKLGIATEEHNYRQSAVIANVSYQKSHQGKAFERFTPRGPLALLPLGESEEAKTSALVWTTPEDEVDHILAMSDENFLANLQKAFGFRLGRFVKVGERNHYSLCRVLAKEQVRSRLVLMGNAAHFLHPVAGQGFNLALRDCDRLVTTLMPHEDVGQLSILSQYLDSQTQDQWLTSAISHSFNDWFSSNHLAKRAPRNVGLLAMNMVPRLKKSFFGQMMGKGFQL